MSLSSIEALRPVSSLPLIVMEVAVDGRELGITLAPVISEALSFRALAIETDEESEARSSCGERRKFVDEEGG
jgi:hypothetical protein